MTGEAEAEEREAMRLEDKVSKRHSVRWSSQDLWQRLTRGYSREYLDKCLEDFEGKEEPEVVDARLREQAAGHRNRRTNNQVDKLLELMAQKGGGNLTLAWRRYFDSDGDGVLSFKEFCNALLELDYGVGDDLVALWKDLSSRGDHPDEDCITLEAIDPVGAAILNHFGRWTLENFGGPWELFKQLDEDGSDSLTADELCEGLENFGYFTSDDLPHEVATTEMVLINLFPLLDQSGCGCVTADQVLFLEGDRPKRDRIKEELKRARNQGTTEIGLTPYTNIAHEMLHEKVMSMTQSGGKHWTTVKDKLAVGGPWTVTLPSPATGSARRLESSWKQFEQFGTSPSKQDVTSPSLEHLQHAASLADIAQSPTNVVKGFDTFVAKRTKELPPLQPSPHVLDHCKAGCTVPQQNLY